MTPEQEATLNIAIMQTDEIFNARVTEVLFKIMRGKEFAEQVQIQLRFQQPQAQ